MLTYILMGTIAMTLLQKLGLSQFFYNFASIGQINNPAVGFVANGALNSNLIAVLSPLFLRKINPINIIFFIIVSVCFL